MKVPGVSNDYFVRAVRSNNRDEMTLSVASDSPAGEFERIRSGVEALLKEELGVRIRCEVVAPGALDEHTELHTSPKPKRFRDER